MRLLLFSDVHSDRGACQKIVEASHDVDVVIGAGDFCNMRRGLEEVIALLSPIATPAVVVPGNAESYEELQQACRQWPSAVVLHGSQAKINGVVFFGIGGGIPVTPFGDWSYDFTEEQAASLLNDCPAECVLVSHSPPKGVLDLSSSGDSLGSETVRSVVEDKKPRLVACGHIHESGGRTEKVGSSTVVNAGPRGVVWEL